jgi:hypothetical protein
VIDQGSLRIRYSGPSLNQTDQMVWKWLADAALQLPLGDPVVFTTTALQHATGRGASGADRPWIVETLARLLTAGLEVTEEGKTNAGSLVASFERDETADEYRVWLNPRMLARWLLT